MLLAPAVRLLLECESTEACVPHTDSSVTSCNVLSASELQSCDGGPQAVMNHIAADAVSDALHGSRCSTERHDSQLATGARSFDAVRVRLFQKHRYTPTAECSQTEQIASTK